MQENEQLCREAKLAHCWAFREAQVCKFAGCAEFQSHKCPFTLHPTYLLIYTFIIIWKCFPIGFHPSVHVWTFSQSTQIFARSFKSSWVIYAQINLVHSVETGVVHCGCLRMPGGFGWIFCLRLCDCVGYVCTHKNLNSCKPLLQLQHYLHIRLKQIYSEIGKLMPWIFWCPVYFLSFHHSVVRLIPSWSLFQLGA